MIILIVINFMEIYNNIIQYSILFDPFPDFPMLLV